MLHPPGGAQGLAAALGDGRITPEHLLIALLWDPTSRTSRILWRLGAPRERILQQPAGGWGAGSLRPLPPQQEIEWGERVRFERADAKRVLDHVRLRLSPGARWGFNHEDDRAWVNAEAGVDLEALVRDALAG